MGYRNQFWTSSDSEPAFLQFTEKSYGDGYLETGNYCVPILWSACFSSADVNFGKLPDDQYPDEEQPIYGLSCDAPLPAAVARLERRLPSVKTVVVPSLHEICDLFVERLKQSHESFVHLHISELLNGDDDPSTGGWQDYWGRLVDGLDVPVTRVRKGAMGRFLGIGLPSSWKYLWYRALFLQKLRHILTAELEAFRLSGAESVEQLQKWRA